MRIRDCRVINGMTVLLFDEDMPHTKWHRLVIDGRDYEPIPVMDAKRSCIAVRGSVSLVGKEVAFV